ncbi:MAG TPA: hypothetical protein VMN36_03455 [Verrucomicrobiales bacterium]|nr:hypothetical protein [Verrucomicrobiales bacterium]
MDGLWNWDDLIHGTAVFSAAAPLLVAGLLTALLPLRWWWLAAILALAGPFLWFFGFPSIPLRSSEDAATAGLVAAAALTSLGATFRMRRPLRLSLSVALWTVLIWILYPAWLAAEGGLTRKVMVAGGLAAATTVWAWVIERLAYHVPVGEGRTHAGMTPAALIPPAIALAVLLQLGGAMRFAQSIGAMAAACAAVLVIWLWRKPPGEGLEWLAALWAMLFAQLAWCGWLFAEIRYGLAALLCAAPLAGVLTRWLPLPRGTPLLRCFWEGLASLLVSSIAAGIALAAYQQSASGYEGY